MQGLWVQQEHVFQPEMRGGLTMAILMHEDISAGKSPGLCLIWGSGGGGHATDQQVTGMPVSSYKLGQAPATDP